MTNDGGADGEARDQDETRSAPVGKTETFGSGRYVVRRLIGEGAQKTVYLVHDTALGRDCALSLLKTELLQADDLARLHREAQTMAGLTHGNIVTVYDISEEVEEGSYLVSEYVPGGDLGQELHEAGGPLPLRRAVALAKDLCRALSVAHEQGIVHRDLKPANIWLTKQGSAKLGDFGIAHSIDRSRLTMPGTLMGSPAYMAPEQAEGRDVTERSDLYSLGCVLYELLTGRPPFEGDDPRAVVSQHVHAQPSPPSEHGIALPEALERLVLRLLAKEPNARPASAEEVLAELERIEAVLPATETAGQTRGLSRLWARPAYRLAAAVLALAAIGGGIAAALILSQSGGDGPQAPETREITSHSSAELVGQIVGGDCVTEDLVVEFSSIEGRITGDVTGTTSATGRTVLYASDGCQSGITTGTSTATYAEGDTLSFEVVGPNRVTLSGDGLEGIAAVGMIAATTITGGTGIYEGATGQGSCTIVGVFEATGEGDVTGTNEIDCQYQLSTRPAAPSELLVVQVGASAAQVAVFGGSADLPDSVDILVIYRNTREETQRGLSLRLPVPEGTEILAVARQEEQAVSTGERTWELPNLPPGETQRFVFTLQFLGADMPTVPLVVEVRGEGFEEPVGNAPVVLGVVQ